MKKNNYDGLDFPETEPLPLAKLRRLVSAMTMAEKNAFKRYIRNYRDNNRDSDYIRLFDCINDCLTEDARKSRKAGRSTLPLEKAETFYQKFRSRNARRKICQPAELGSKANYLFEKLLESQRGLNPHKSKRRDLYMRMLDVQLLYAKDLREECLTVVRDACKMAAELEALPQLLELMQYKRLLLTKSRQNNLEQSLREIYKLEEKYLLQLQMATFFNDLRTEIVLLEWKQGKVDEEEVLRSKINFFLEYAREGKPFDDTFDLNFYYHAILAGLIRLDLQQPSHFLDFLQHQGYETITTHFKAIVGLYKRYPERKKENFARYLGDLSNYLSSAYSMPTQTMNLDDFKSDLEKIELTDPNFLNYTVYFTLIDGIKGRRFKEARSFLLDKKVWERTVNLRHQAMPSRLQVIRQLAGTVFFVREEFAEADRWFKANLEESNAAIINASALIASELYHLLARYELGLTAAITHKKELLAQLARRLGLYVDPDTFENILLDALDKILKTDNTPVKLKVVCEQYLPVLKKKLAEKPDSSQYHLLIGWLESKISGKSLRVAVDPYL